MPAQKNYPESDSFLITPPSQNRGRRRRTRVDQLLHSSQLSLVFVSDWFVFELRIVVFPDRHYVKNHSPFPGRTQNRIFHETTINTCNYFDFEK